MNKDNNWNAPKTELALLILGIILGVFVAVNYAWLLIDMYA